VLCTVKAGAGVPSKSEVGAVLLLVVISLFFEEC
jgi:hypothetical protein